MKIKMFSYFPSSVFTELQIRRVACHQAGVRVRVRIFFVTGMAACMQDTVTGFLLAGIGNIDIRRHSNFLIVTDSTPLTYALVL